MQSTALGSEISLPPCQISDRGAPHKHDGCSNRTVCIPRPAVTRASLAGRPPGARSGMGGRTGHQRRRQIRNEGVTFPPPNNENNTSSAYLQVAHIIDNKQTMQTKHPFLTYTQVRKRATPRTYPLPASHILHAPDDFVPFAGSNTRHASYSAIGPRCEPETTGGPASAIHREWARRSLAGLGPRV